MQKKKLVILGAGISGVGTAVLAQKKGYDVFVSDFGSIKEVYQNELHQLGIEFEEGKHTLENILQADEVVKSPGIADKLPVIVSIKEKNIPVISEIEFAARYTDAYKICITGSNGKTTIVSWIYHIFRKAGVNVKLVGNVGDSFARSVADDDVEVYILELSSFQLDGMYDFKADVAIISNITPDHLDRYDYSFIKYARSKFRILQNMTQNDFFIYCEDDKAITGNEEFNTTETIKLPFSIEKNVPKGAYCEDNKLVFNFKTGIEMDLNELALKGKHNTYNSMAAGLAAMVYEIKNETIRQSLADFTGVAHRLEKVAYVGGVEFINDSKATNINSTWFGLDSMRKPTVWIAGGIDKGNDYSELLNLVQEKVKVLICLGKDNEKLKKSFKGFIPTIIETNSMQEAVQSAYFLAKKGDAVLLSPACASFDLFANYEERGDMFKNEVKNL